NTAQWPPAPLRSRYHRPHISKPVEVRAQHPDRIDVLLIRDQCLDRFVRAARPQSKIVCQTHSLVSNIDGSPVDTRDLHVADSDQRLQVKSGHKARPEQPNAQRHAVADSAYSGELTFATRDAAGRSGG